MLARILQYILIAGVAVVAGLPLTAASSQEPPDLTEGYEIPASANHDWNLGATGARGWMYSDKMTTSMARQIAVTEVARKSPADGVLEVGDVILGVNGKPFEKDPRLEFGRALTKAESKAGRGRLTLSRWRKGKTKKVVVKIPVLGSYSETAPYECEKSERILKQGCAALAEQMEESSYKPNPIPRCLNALALLASGERKYRKLIEREVEWASEFSTTSFQTWHYGYVCMLLAEYTLATGDDDYLPGLRRLALEAARGQSIVGSWGHKFAQPNGRLAGYGMMNAPGVPLTIALIMARRAGVEDEEVKVAIERSVDLLRFYVGKGAVPYGDHHPWIETHEDNGKCGMAAVLFDLFGETDAANFFARMSVASHGSERDTGHTGNFFNLFWAMPAISRSGPAASGAWMEEYGAWYFDSARRWDGTFAHLGPPQSARDSYHDWDATGAYLLAYAMPLRKLVLTGKEASIVPQLAAKEAAALIEDGRDWNPREKEWAYGEFSDKELLRRLGSWSPVVRERAAITLARNKADVVPNLIKMLKSSRLEERIGACQALAHMRGKASSAVPALQAALEHDDLWLRVKAAEALGVMGEVAMPALPMIFNALVREPEASDPRRMEQRYLCFVLFDQRNGMLRRNLDGVDMEPLYAAIRAGLTNEDGRARSAVSNIYDQLSFETIEPLLPLIHEATMESSPSGIMFADGVRMAGLRLLAKHRIEEGIEACVYYIRHMKQHASEHRVPQVLEILQTYGVHAQRAIPRLHEIADYFENEELDFPKRLSKQKAASVREAILILQDASESPTLISMD
ncbi:MAG: acetylesterase [Planctomycetes bacterium]|nr:acetylesterase [Planctomycetota bacterium]MCP4771145.1 acetylesterase [Planctomycetota bacterium]MCP4862128.1 acetylesterase [Planctomycetota bacterium]